MPASLPYRRLRKTDRKEELIKILRETGGNRSETARRLGVSRVTVWKLMKKYNINDLGKN